MLPPLIIKHMLFPGISFSLFKREAMVTAAEPSTNNPSFSKLNFIVCLMSSSEQE